jgi:hypothetical protein
MQRSKDENKAMLQTEDTVWKKDFQERPAQKMYCDHLDQLPLCTFFTNSIVGDSPRVPK